MYLTNMIKTHSSVVLVVRRANLSGVTAAWFVGSEAKMKAVASDRETTACAQVLVAAEAAWATAALVGMEQGTACP